MFGKRLGLDSNHRLHRQVCVGCDYCSSCRRKAVFAALGAPTTTRQLPTWVGLIRLDGHLPKEEYHGQRRRWRGSMMRWLRRCQAPSNWWAIPTTWTCCWNPFVGRVSRRPQQSDPPHTIDGRLPARDYSRRTCVAGLSVRRPTNAAWRRLPPAVHSVNATFATRGGFTPVSVSMSSAVIPSPQRPVFAVGRFTKGTLGSQAPCGRSGMASGHPSSVPAHRWRRLQTSGMLAAAPLASAVVS